MDLKNTKISLKIKEQLKKDISKLGYNEHCEIFNIIRKDTDKMSENSNGIFINLKYLKDETLIKVQNFVTYCKNNKNLINNEKENKLNNLSNTNNQINKITIKENLSQGYESYNIDDEFLDEKKKDKFNFKNYMEKLSIHSFKKFDENEVKLVKNNSVPNILNKKIKLFGVKERIMKKCRNISKQQTDKINRYKLNKRNLVEEILEDNISEIDTMSNISDNISISDKNSYVCEELTEDF